MRTIDVTPIEIRDYAISYGWTLVKDALKEGLFILNSPSNDFKQLMFPIEPTRNDFNSLAELAISKISDHIQKPIFNIVEEIREVNDDVISLRYYSENKIVNSLSFQETVETIEATKQLILTAGSSVINPVLYHKRLSRTEATGLLKNVRFRHTEEGSFIIKISCPIQLDVAPTNDLFGEKHTSKPISRQAFELINDGAVKILESIEQDNFGELFEEQTKSDKPIISYNLCDSLSSLFEDERELPMELNFTWSRAYLKKLPTPTSPHLVRFPYSFKPKIEELKNYFAPVVKEAQDTFLGSVETLNGEINNDGERDGEIILALLIDSEIVKAKAILNATDYKKAWEAHEQTQSFVKLKGTLLPGKRIRTLRDISEFSIIAK